MIDDLVTSPDTASKRVIRLTFRCGPPTLSHGSQKLYELPSDDLL